MEGLEELKTLLYRDLELVGLKYGGKVFLVESQDGSVTVLLVRQVFQTSDLLELEKFIAAAAG